MPDRDKQAEQLALAALWRVKEDAERQKIGLPPLPLSPGSSAVISPGEWIDSAGRLRHVHERMRQK